MEEQDEEAGEQHRPSDDDAGVSLVLVLPVDFVTAWYGRRGAVAVLNVSSNDK